MLNAYVLNEQLYKFLQGGGACSFGEKKYKYSYFPGNLSVIVTDIITIMIFSCHFPELLSIIIRFIQPKRENGNYICP